MLTPYLVAMLMAAPARPVVKPNVRASVRSAAAIPARVQLRKQRLDRWYNGRGTHVIVNYPEVVGLADKALQARINRTIRSAFPPPRGLKAWLETSGGDPKQGEVDQLDGDYEVTYNRNHLLSIRFSGLQEPLKNGRLMTAHPNPVDGAVTLDTRTGKPFKLADLFAGPQWREHLEKLIARYAGLGPRPRKPAPEDPALMEELKHHDYWYHLTARGVRFYDLYLAYAGNAVEAEIPLEQLRPLMNPKGPLPSLIRTGIDRTRGRD